MPLDEANIYLSEDELNSLVMMNDMCFVEVFDNRNKTESGIHIPITVDNPFIPNVGVIVKLPDNYDGLLNISDYVIIEKYKGRRFFCNDRQFLLLNINYILCKMEG